MFPLNDKIPIDFEFPRHVERGENRMKKIIDDFRVRTCALISGLASHCDDPATVTKVWDFFQFWTGKAILLLSESNRETNREILHTTL